MLHHRRLLMLAAALTLTLGTAAAEDDYRARFEASFPPVDPAPAWEGYATAARFDALYLAAGWDAGLDSLNNDDGGMAWGTSYQMMALNGMYEATGDVKYLRANRQLIRAVIAVTDAKRGKTLADGRSVEAWGCEKYSEAGRAVHAVHTGIITWPIFDFLRLAKRDPALQTELGAEFGVIAAAGRAALAVHEAQWRLGPEEGAGRYLVSEFEKGDATQALPGNWQSAMGLAWYRAGQALDDAAATERGLQLGRYIRARLSPATDGAYYWPYSLPAEAVTATIERDALGAEDTSHAGLTMALPFALGQEGVVFTSEDLTRLGHTVAQGFAPHDDGLLYPTINSKTGTLDPGSYISFPSRWIWLSRYVPEAGEHLRAFYLRHRKTPAALEIADLLRWGAEK